MPTLEPGTIRTIKAGKAVHDYSSELEVWPSGVSSLDLRKGSSMTAAIERRPSITELLDSTDARIRCRASRVDVSDQTAVGHRVQLGRVLPLLGDRRIDEITPADVAELVAALHAAGRKRETIRRSVTVLAQVLDFAGVKENPARDRVTVRLPREEREEPTPPSAGQIEAVARLLSPIYRLAVLVLDATGMRVGELEQRGLTCGDLDEPDCRWRVRRAVEKGRRGRWVSLPPDLFAAVVATLPPREDRDPEAPVFPGLTQERLRTAITRACKATGTPAWSPHDLRHRRISLWHRQGETWALIGQRVGQRSLSVTADTYTHVLIDDRELDHCALAAETASASGDQASG